MCEGKILAMPSVEEEIRDFIMNEIMTNPPSRALGIDDPLIESGVIDSVAIYSLIGFIGERFAVEIDEGQVSVENFATIQDIASLVMKGNPAASSGEH